MMRDEHPAGCYRSRCVQDAQATIGAVQVPGTTVGTTVQGH